MNLRYAPLYAFAVPFTITVLVLVGVPIVALLLLQVAGACPLLAMALIGDTARRAPVRIRATRE